MVIYPREVCYMEVTPEDVPEIVSKTVLGNSVVDRLIYRDPNTGETAAHASEIPFYGRQMRHLIGPNTRISPQSLEDYLAIGGYAALSKALFEMTPDGSPRRNQESQPARKGGWRIPSGFEMADHAQCAPGMKNM